VKFNGACSKYITFIAFLFFFCLFKTDAQLFSKDSITDIQTKDSVVALFNSTVKGNIGLYNGSEYLYGGHNVKGFPYFKSDDILNGSVLYDGNLYNDVSMRFDLTTNELIIPDYTRNFPIKLLTSKLDYFVIDSSRFINAANNYGIPLPQTTDFYQVLYNNKSTVLARKEKQLILSSKLDENDSHYMEFNWYYIYVNGKLYEVDKEKSVLNAFEEKKTDLKKFIKANGISFKKDFENAVVRTTVYYDQLKN